MYRPITFLLVLGIGLLVTGCGRGNRTENPPSTPRQSAAGEITFTISQAPAEWSTAERGAFLLEGVVTASQGINPQNPNSLRLRVEEVVAGFSQELPITISSPLSGPLSLDPSTGQFRLDFTGAWRIGEGFQRLTLIAQDAQGNEEQWIRHVVSSPSFNGWSWAEEAQARRVYGVRMVPLFAVYREFAQVAVERGIDETAFAHLDYDLALLRDLEHFYLDAMIRHADKGQWKAIGEALEQRVTELNGDLASLPVAEQHFRKHIDLGGATEHTILAIGYSARRSDQICSWCGGPGTEAPDMQKWKLAFYRHTFPRAEWSAVEGGLEYRAEIRTDTGTMASNCCPEVPPFVEPVAGTASGNPPVFELVVTLLDTNEDGLLDQLTFDGSIEGAPFANAIPAEFLSSHGHLVTPLEALQYSDYFSR
ncbi:MAG: hypothetical protein GEEBNDBF_02299 [bacterium]|nr:hypothetical protein [bacterium]